MTAMIAMAMPIRAKFGPRFETIACGDESAGLDALIRGFQLSVPDDHEKLLLTRPLYDALYAYCQAKVDEPRPKQGAPRPRLRYTQRVAEHVEDADV